MFIFTSRFIEDMTHSLLPLSVFSFYYKSASFYICWIFISLCPFSSSRQHVSYDGCLEVRREIIRTVLCCIVY